MIEISIYTILKFVAFIAVIWYANGVWFKWKSAQLDALKHDYYITRSLPIVVHAADEWDRSVEERAQDAREWLKRTGNRFLDPEKDVHAMVWRGVSRGTDGKFNSAIGEAFHEYRQRVCEYERQLLQAFQVRIADAGGQRVANETTARQTGGGHQTDWTEVGGAFRFRPNG